MRTSIEDIQVTAAITAGDDPHIAGTDLNMMIDCFIDNA